MAEFRPDRSAGVLRVPNGRVAGSAATSGMTYSTISTPITGLDRRTLAVGTIRTTRPTGTTARDDDDRCRVIVVEDPAANLLEERSNETTPPQNCYLAGAFELSSDVGFA
jgi:hypothetical protein